MVTYCITQKYNGNTAQAEIVNSFILISNQNVETETDSSALMVMRGERSSQRTLYYGPAVSLHPARQLAMSDMM
jgi:hypothetical protein